MQNLPLIIKLIITAIIGATPVIELRGAIPIAVFSLKLNYIQAFLAAFVGNILPVYFIIKYIGYVFKFLERFKIFKKFITWITNRATKKIEENPKLQTAVALGLFLFVAIPVPGTGAWIGSLIANILGEPPKKAIPPIILGVFTAGVIILTSTAIVEGGISALLK